MITWMPELKGRALMRMTSFTDEEMMNLIDLAAQLKARRRAGVRGDLLHRKTIALIFEKSSTRTRNSSVIAARAPGISAIASDAMRRRSCAENRLCFSPLLQTRSTTLSKTAPQRSTRSICPFVIGSKVPVITAVFFMPAPPPLLLSKKDTFSRNEMLFQA